jgi:pyruvate dehydrogenase E2 component (dihydrolipoamide acetyltransferase)
MAVEVFMPKLSDNMESGEIVEWLVAEGTQVEKGQPILLILTDKATVELEAPAAGILNGIRPGAAPGSNISVGENIALILQAGEILPTVSGSAAKAADTPTTVTTKETKTSPETHPSREDVYVKVAKATPVIRRMAKDLGIDLSKVHGTGPDGRITREDVLAFVEVSKKSNPLSQSTFSGIQSSQELSNEASEKWVELTAVQRLTGQRMLQSVQTAPQFSLTVNVDMMNSLQMLASTAGTIIAEAGDKPSITGLLVKVVASILQEMPRVNASFIDGRLKFHQQINIGIAVGSDNGLFVPVVKNANRKSLSQITVELKDFKQKVMHLSFNLDDLKGSTFTISNLGMYGIDRFNAIVNPPESAILTAGRVVKMPVGMPDDSIALRPMMSLTLSIDHRTLDGLQGAKFITRIKECLEQPFQTK